MYKVEIELGLWGDNKITIETSDFSIVNVMQAFVEWQDSVEWLGEYETVEDAEDEDDDEEVEVEDEEADKAEEK